jgi:hypothetical protein
MRTSWISERHEPQQRPNLWRVGQQQEEPMSIAIGQAPTGKTDRLFLTEMALASALALLRALRH